MAKYRIQPVSGVVILLILALGSGYGIYAMARVTVHDQASLKVTSRNIVINKDAAGESNVYQNSEYGFKLTRPDGWAIVETEPQGLAEIMLSVTFTDSVTDDRIIFSVLSPTTKNALRNSLSLEREEETKLGNLPAEKWIGEDLKDGSPVTIVTAETDGRLYEVTSYAPSATLDSFLSEFKIVR